MYFKEKNVYTTTKWDLPQARKTGSTFENNQCNPSYHQAKKRKFTRPYQ